MAEKRVALVVGNDEYPSLGADEQLLKAVNDANAVGDALAKIGFDVTRGENLSRAGMLASLLSAADKLEPGDLAFFFYAGHGVTIDGANYLLPSDIPPAAAGGEDLIKLSAVSESTVVSTLTARGVRVAMVVLDACRNNPFSQGGTRSFGGGTRGLTRPAAIETRGVFELYSAGIGETALDRLSDEDPDPNSVFTRILAPALATPGKSLLDIAYEVNEEVARLASTVGHDQNPAYYDQARARDVYIAGRAPEGAAAVEPVRSECAVAEAHYKEAVRMGTREAFEDHVRRFGDCAFAGLAAQRLALFSDASESATDAPVVLPQQSPSQDIVVPLAEWNGGAPEFPSFGASTNTASTNTPPDPIVVPEDDIVVPAPPGYELFLTPPSF
jgi:hypothetical protein